ncbi:DNA cytosine methyltransferase [Deinococcus misasensis]|uniref:DNA cytosine methyltransferase n=1 Tax=Deinococcus misasensis TaxID=392413 RepID=UPI00068EC282|nr:DNA cytosine methyltransferase [Deinococcus misasensis]
MTYPDFLRQCWSDAHAPRAQGAPTVASFFAGGGGSSTGYHMAGFKEVLAVDWEQHAVDTLRLNYPHLQVWHGDIAQLSVPEFFRLTGLQVGELDVLDGSPPCQGFSTSGKRMIDDPRNQLFREFVRLLRGVQPRAFVMENVAGMVKGKMKQVFAEILTELKSCGYEVACRKLNASFLGVPQARERMIFVGFRKDLKLQPVFPVPHTRPVTVREAFEGLPEDQDSGLIQSEFGKSIWAKVKPGQGFDEAHPKGHWFNSHKLDPNKPALTISKTVFGNGASGIYHWRYPRLINLGELKRLGSFPDEYQFPGEFKEAWARVGNSVPPLMMREIALCVKRQLEQARSVDH